jgi:hypothetical protein
VNPKARILLFTLTGAALGIFIGIKIADENYGWAVVAALAACWIMIGRMSNASPDTWLLAGALVGYIVGNRGFAQIQPWAQIPLLPAEAALLVTFPLLIVRMAVNRATGFRNDALNYSILVWLIIGSVRLPFDMNRFGVMALRDFAMVYYAAFFFIAQAFGSNTASETLLRKSFTLSFLLLIPVVISILISPDFLVDHLTLRGIPIIYHKSDLIATSLAAGFFWLWTRWDKSHRRPWLAAAAASLLLVALMASPRAGMFAIAVTTLLWLLVGRWRMAAFQVGIACIASLAAVAVTAYQGRDLKTSVTYSMYEHVASFFDPAGTGTYINNESGDLGGNNQFRLIWWRDVIEDTVAANPTLGLGFGADLSSRFLADYDLLSDESFAARSPHSMIVTVFGRMGFAGLIAWIVISGSLARLVWKGLKSGDPDGMGFGSIALVIWLSACFGVVLEGPMGAVIFWTALGLASSRINAAVAAAARPGADPQAERPIAKAAAPGTQSFPR